MQMNRRRFSMALMAGASALFLASGAARAEEGKTVALMFDAFDSDFWITGNAILKSKAEENGWTVLETISNRDQNKQNDQVKAMVERKVDGIIFIPTDNNAAIPAIRTANEAGIPIVFFNRPPAPNDNKYVAIQADNRKIMQQTVQALVDLAREQGGTYKAALMIGDLGDNNAVQRRDGALDILDQNKDVVEVVAQIATEWNADKAFAGLTNAIQANPDINMLISPSDSQDAVIEQVLKTAGKWHKTGEEGHVLFAGFDGDQNGYRLLKDGYMDVNGVQNLFFEADLAYQALEDAWAGKEVDQMLIDPGFAISQKTLAEKQDEMWGYHVWKEPLTVRNRTMVKSLHHKTLTEDSTRCSVANADYLLIFRRSGDNPVPVAHPVGLTDYAGSRTPPPDVLKWRGYKGDQIKNAYSHWVWRQYASAFRDDVRIDRTLGSGAGLYSGNKADKDEPDEKHMHPLQLDVIERAVVLWSNPGETVLTPFMGVGSEVYGAVLNGRRGVGIELKAAYFR
ncbi:MAG: substrate-binding domain-containing protein, partial [Rhizobiales bacterium]|nr:substrate-binding domain-containing protein [Hyphomicrobiales bacterium]